MPEFPKEIRVFSEELTEFIVNYTAGGNVSNRLPELGEMEDDYAIVRDGGGRILSKANTSQVSNILDGVVAAQTALQSTRVSGAGHYYVFLETRGNEVRWYIKGPAPRDLQTNHPNFENVYIISRKKAEELIGLHRVRRR